MGMYDEIGNDIVRRVINKCPFCGEPFEYTEWQSKSFECILHHITLQDLKDDDKFEIYTICNKCNKYIKLKLQSHITLEIIEKNFK